MLTYSDLQAYWECPRQLGYALRWEAPTKPAAMLRGIFVHLGIQAGYQGQDWLTVIHQVASQYISDLEKGKAVESAEQPAEARKAAKAAEDAVDMVGQYLAKYAQSIKPIGVEVTLRLLGRPEDIGGHADVVGLAPDGTVALVELKSGEPSLEALDHSGQADYYAYLWKEIGRKPVVLLYLDAITQDYTYRHTRPPRLERGWWIGERLKELAMITAGLGGREWLLDNPHFGAYRCRTCPFFGACKVREAGGDDEDYAIRNYWTSERRG